MSAFDIPKFLYITVETKITMMYGSPCPKYKLGTQAHGVVFDPLLLIWIKNDFVIVA
jgi:hypothetical protein